MKLFGFYIFRNDPRTKNLDEETLKKIKEFIREVIIINAPLSKLSTDDVIKNFNDRYEKLLYEYHELMKTCQEQKEYFLGIIKTYRDAQ